MPAPLPDAIVRQVQALPPDVSQRRAAKMFQISPQTVARVRRGERKPANAATPNESPTNPRAPVRCRGCGGRVTPPCRVCAVRRWKRNQALTLRQD